MPLDAKWKQTVDMGIADKAWDEYDALIQAEVDAYQKKFAGTPGFIALDWKLFKAMVWVESGGPSNASWKTRPLQIGNPGDPGYGVLKDGKEAAPLIMLDKLKQDIKTGDINKPELNIRAGIAYALTRLVTSDMKSVDDPKNSKVYDYTVVAGDNFSKIAKDLDTTVESLQKQNPTAHVLKVGQKIKYRKASIQRVITGWSAISTTSLATRYNSGDPDYKEKLEYVLALFPKLVRAAPVAPSK